MLLQYDHTIVHILYFDLTVVLDMTDLGSFLQSFYAVYSVPFNVNSEISNWMSYIQLISTSSSTPLFASFELPPSHSLSESPFYCMSQNLWTYFQTPASPVHPNLINAIASEMSVYHRLENQWLELVHHKLPPAPAVRRKTGIKKLECMYRTKWNKRRPLGVSNLVYNEYNPIVPEISSRVEIFLGITCPLPQLDELRAMDPVSVFRSLQVVPRYSVPVSRVAKLLFKVLKEVEKKKIYKFLQMGRFDVMEGDDHFFKSVVVPLISYCFYVTESGPKVYYFRRPVWDIIVGKCSLALISELELSPSEETGSTVRWIPKISGGLRPVVSQPKFQKDQTKKLLRYLTCLVEANPSALGHSVLTRSACTTALSELKGFDKLFYFVADFQNCFETILFNQLENALSKLADEETLFSSAMLSTHKIGAPIRKRPVVFLRSNLPNLLKQIPKSEKPMLVALGPISPERMNFQQVAQKVMNLVKSTVFNLSVAGRTKGFSVTRKGLLQGSPFSCLLVSLLFGDKDIPANNNYVMVRLIDDVLCFAKNSALRDSLLHRLPLYGTVNESKLQIGSTLDKTPIQWSGFVFRPRDSKLNISVSPSSVPPVTVSSLLDFFNSTLSRSIAQNCLPLLLDPKLNSIECIKENAFQAGKQAALRLKSIRCRKYGDPFVKKLIRFIKRRFNIGLQRMFFMGFECGLKKIQ